MEPTNQKTLESYETGIAEYIQHAPNKRGGAVENWIDISLESLRPGAKILEIGSADGQDARIIEEKGFYVEKTDATKAFVELLQKEDPNARILNVLSDEIKDTYDLIIANAVLLHFDNEETQLVVTKAYAALNAGGVFSFTVKQGNGEAWQSNKGMAPRFFNFWTKEGIEELLTSAGFNDIDVWTDSSDGVKTTWIMVVAKKA